MANGGSRRGLYGEGRRTAVAAETHSPPHVRRILHLTFRGPDQLAIRAYSGRGKEDIHPIALLRLLVEEGLLLLLLLLFLARGSQKKVSRSKFQK